ncbi:cytochrome c oxidase assembly factor 8 [Solea solea]|uniref:cytochrome c oxidase assembly factor 8 n=1 Tax=Solea solea TaxID=90069 RepID=UPI00272A69AB|nr:cytochrome c oxidase assembly factor 8 [Solea solea]
MDVRMSSVVMKSLTTWRNLRANVSSAVKCRLCSSSSSSSCGLNKQQDTTNNKWSNSRPAADSTYDWIGPPNPLSNLRPIVYHVPENESPLQRRLRTLRQETEDWNHQFWTKQNIAFNKEKHAFITSQLKEKGLGVRDENGRRRSLDSEEMAKFYKNFLDENTTRHANYNREWYRRNFTITFLMARVTLRNMWTNVRHKKTSSPSSPSSSSSSSSSS